MIKKLLYKVLYASSESETNNVLNILSEGDRTKSHGWQSAPNCKFPQEICLEMQCPAKLKRIEIISHQSKISTKCEIYITQPGSYSLTKLGVISFKDNNDMREKKIVKTDCDCEKLKFVFGKNYFNEKNDYNQIGIVSIDLYGEDINKNSELIKQLESKKKVAVEKEDYDEAKRINKELEQLKAEISGTEKGKKLKKSTISRYNEDDEDKAVIAQKKDTNINNIKKQSVVPDIDNMQVGNSLTFSQMVEKQLNGPSTNNGNQKSQKTVNISDEDKEKASALLSILPESVVYPLYTKQSKTIDEALQTIISDLEKYPNSSLFNTNESENIIDAIIAITNLTISSSFATPKLSTLTLLTVALDKLVTKSSTAFPLDKIISLLGDTNQKIKEQTKNLILNYVSKTSNTTKPIQLLTNIPSQPKQNNLLARIILLNEILTSFKYEDSLFTCLINFAVKCYSNPKVTIRESSLETIVILYQKFNDKIRDYLSSLRPAQKKTIEDKIDEINLNAEKHLNPLNSMSVQIEHTCEFCGLYNETLTPDQITMHQYKECPMLMLCEKCNQIVEIRKMEQHKRNECIEKEETDEKPKETSDIYCPLCRHELDDNEVWRKHFIYDDVLCENNPRCKK